FYRRDDGRSWPPQSCALQKVDELSAHDVGLLFLWPVAGAVDQLHASEFRVPARSGGRCAAGDSIGTPLLNGGDELRRHIDGSSRECQLLGDVGSKRRAAVPVVVQRAGPA